MKVSLIYLEPLDNEPMGLLYIGTVLQAKGHDVMLQGFRRHNPEDVLARQIKEFYPDVVGLSVTSALAGKAKAISRFIKSKFPFITIIAGGPHPTILPQDMLEDSAIDICVIGEGEETIVTLCQRLSLKSSFEEVKGIAFLKEGRLIVTEVADFIADMDKLPFVNRELLPKDVIYGRAGYPVTNPCMLMMTVRGCPYQCSFCQPTVERIFGRRVRRRSADNVVEEMVELKKRYGIKGLWINDDTFLFDSLWTNRFCDLLLERDLDIDWYTNGRINNVEPRLLSKMVKAGCVGIVLTPETGSQRIRNEVLNKGVTDTQVLTAYRICHEIGLPAQANIMLASPTETSRELASSLSLIKMIQPHFMNFSYTTALPGTYLYQKYSADIGVSGYYKDYSDYDIGRFKRLGCDIGEKEICRAWNFFKARYANGSFSNRARHFLRYPYFRKIILRRWKSLIFSRHPKFRHLLYDICAILLGIPIYIINRGIYTSSLEKEALVKYRENRQG